MVFTIKYAGLSGVNFPIIQVCDEFLQEEFSCSHCVQCPFRHATLMHKTRGSGHVGVQSESGDGGGQDALLLKWRIGLNRNWSIRNGE